MTVEQLFANHHFSAIVPEVTLTVFALAVLLLGAFLGDAQRRVAPIVALLGVAVTGATLVPLWNGQGAETFGPANHAIFLDDDFSIYFKWIFLLGLGVSVLLSGRFMQARGGDRHTVIGEYYGLMMLSTVGMMIVASAGDLLTVFLGIETLSIALYILAGFARTRLMSNEAALKYFLLGAFASGFLLYGIALTYYSIGSTHLATISATLGKYAGGDNSAVRSMPILLVGLALLLIGLGFKAALVPFHQWTPDVYEGSPTPVTAFMATGAKAAAFAALLRVFPEAFGVLSPQWHGLVLLIAVLTMTIGNIVALSQDGLKRMLAYSSIAHAGYILVGVLAAGAANRAGNENGAADAIASVLFYTLTYALMNLGAFAVLVHIENSHEESSDEVSRIGIRELEGLSLRQPAAAFAMAVFLLSLAGIPPTAGFFGKFFVFREAVAQGLIGLVIVGVLNSVISIYYYLRPIVTMYGGEEIGAMGASVGADGAVVASAPTARPMTISIGFAIGICAVLVLGMIVLQGIAMPLAQSAARSLLQAG